MKKYKKSDRYYDWRFSLWCKNYEFTPAGPDEIYLALYRDDELFGLGPMKAQDMDYEIKRYANRGFKAVVIEQDEAIKMWMKLMSEKQGRDDHIAGRNY